MTEGQKKKILIGEDEKPLARTMNLKLSKAGFAVTVAYNGEEALEAIKKDTFDLIILDIVMPKMDGFGLLVELRKMGNKTPVMITSNLSQPEDEKKAKDLGAQDYFIKSNVSLVQIVDHVKNLLKT
ncbi:MAG: response regulator [Candidatus Paceibacterota bacterium]